MYFGGQFNRTYFVEYNFPVVTSSKEKERRVALATELTRVASKKVFDGGE